MDEPCQDASRLLAQLNAERAAAAERERELLQYKREHQDLETLLQAARSEYRTTFEQAAIGIAHVGCDGKFLRVNPFLCQMLGYDAEELLGLGFQDVTYPKDLTEDLDFAVKLLEGDLTSYRMEKRYLRKDGQIVWGHLTVSLVRDRYGYPDYFISFIKNIDQRKHAIDEVERSRGRLKAVLDTLAEGVFVFDEQGQLLEVNSAAMQLCGYEHESDVSGIPGDLAETFDVFDLDGNPVPTHRWPITHLLAGKSSTEAEFVIRRKDSGHGWVGCFRGWSIAPKKDEPPLLVLTVQDVTTRKNAEAAARAGADRLRLAFDNVPDAIVIYDSALRIQAVNSALLEQVGMAKEELLGKRKDEVDQHFLLMWQGALRAAFSEGALQHEEKTFTDGTGLRSFAITCVPLVDGTRKVTEVMVICHDYSEREQAEERVRHAALHDPLTGLPNRALLFEYARHMFAAAGRSGESVAAAFIDLDRFKPINDLLGHATGDVVLREVASRLQAGTRGQDIVFRLGGDEFLILLPGLGPERPPERVARHVLAALNETYIVDGTELSLSASIGISLYPDNADDVDTLITQADAAMYEAKQAGKNQIRLYTPDLAQKVQGRQRIENSLRKAIVDKELCLHYQPLINTRTSQVVSMEALVRMTNSEISPEHFVPIAESSGLIAELSNWVLEEVGEQLARWRKDGLPTIPVAINVSALQFRNKAFIESLISAIRLGQFHPDEIQIELTETAVMEDIQNAIHMLQRLRGEGVKVSLDDFGTGYSSLNYLSRLPLDKIKVDKSFIHRVLRDNGSRAITSSIIALGQALGLKIVAEGIESEAELDYLRDHGCDEVQGYYVCRPVTGSAFSAWYRGYEVNGCRH